ncbi:hypothetical protein EDD17DRAFT_1507838 [Pisolithus thermaeus]|nr:hypothetical protein EDD17DRAFT_1507838 [Pisolithus thermaeus]
MIYPHDHNPGGTLQWLTESSQEVENDESVPSMPTGHVEKVHGSMKQHVPEACRMLLEERIDYMSDSAYHKPRYHLWVTLRGVEGEMAGGDVEPRDGKDNMTSSGNVNSE